MAPAACPLCRHPNPEENHFCGRCGAALGVSASVDRRKAVPRWDERKIVTVLFADIVGFTAYSEQIDPEEVRDTVRELFGRLTRAITGQGGTVDKYIGDCVMALFGAPASHEDDPERAVRAALAMHDELKVYRAERKLDIGLRIGINTGRVLAGQIGSRSTDYTVIGDEVNLAARLEQAAPVDGTLIGRKTFRHVQELFECRPLSPLQVKGKKDLIQVYQVLSSKSPRTAGSAIGRLGVRMIGRERESAWLRETADRVWVERRPRLILVVGPAGIGKSRLLDDFERGLGERASRPLILRGQSFAHTANVPYQAFSHAVKVWCGVRDEDKAAEVRRKIVSGANSILSELEAGQIEASAHLMASLFHVDFPESPHLAPLRRDCLQLHQAARQAAVRFLREACRGSAALCLEDMHWIDQPSLDLLAEAFQECRGRGLLVLGLARPEMLECLSDLERRFGLVELVKLEQLSLEAAGELVSEHLQGGQASQAFLSLVFEKSSGNPYYVEEMVRMLLDQGAVARDDGGLWEIVEARRQAIEIPDTIQGLLQARLDRLSAEEKGVLQRGSIVGERFWKETVDALLDEIPVGSTNPILGELTRKDFIQNLSRSSFMGDEFAFIHALLRDVTYETILKKKRPKYHAILAQWLDANAGERRDEFLPLIAYHYERGGVPERAETCYLQAGRLAQKTAANHEALAYYQKSMSLADPPGFEHHRSRGSCLEDLGEYSAALKDYEALLAAASSDVQRGAALRHLAEIRIRLGEYKAALGFVEQMAEIAGRLRDSRMQAESLNLRGRIHDFAGETDAALRFYTESMEAHRRLKDPVGEAIGLGNIGVVRLYRGEYDQAISAYQDALAIDRAQNDKRRMTLILSNLGEAYLFLGAVREAERYAGEALALSREIGFKLIQVDSARNLGLARMLAGRSEEGLSLLRESLRIAQVMGDMEMLPQILHSYGEVLLAAGKTAEAREVLDRLLGVVEQKGIKDFLAKGLRLQSELVEGDEKRSCLERGLRIAEELQSHPLLWDFNHALAKMESSPAGRKKYIGKAKKHVDFVASGLADAALRGTFLESAKIAPILALHRQLEA